MRHPLSVGDVGKPHDDFDRNRVEHALEAKIPDRLWELYAAGDGRFCADGQWWVIWPLERLVSENVQVRAGRSATLPTSLVAFGDDGTGNPFCVPLDGADRVVRWNWIDGELDGEFGTLSEFVAEWVESDQ